MKPADKETRLPSETLEADTFWRGFAHFNSFEDFEAAASRVSFRAEVPDEVEQRFEAVRQLIRFSYFDASLLDVALERVLFSFELALKHRHQELGSPLGKRPTLARLIQWGGSANLFEDDVNAADAIRRFRNRAAHPNPGQIRKLRYLALTMVLSIPRFVNELYDDPRLRQARVAERDQLNALLNDATKEGGNLDLQAVGGPRLLVFRAGVLHVDNRQPPHPAELHVAFWTLFDPTADDGEVDLGKPIALAFQAWQCDEKRVVLREREGSPPVAIEPIQSGANQEKYRTWRRDLQDGPIEFEAINEVVTYHLAELRIKCRTALQ